MLLLRLQSVAAMAVSQGGEGGEGGEDDGDLRVKARGEDFMVRVSRSLIRVPAMRFCSLLSVQYEVNAQMIGDASHAFDELAHEDHGKDDQMGLVAWL